MVGPLDLTAQLLPDHTAPLPDMSHFETCPGVSAAGLSPVNFRGHRPRPVSCYALLRG